MLQKNMKKKHNWNCPKIPNHPYRILITRDSGSGKANALLNLANHKLWTYKIYLYAEDPYEAKYQFFINKRRGPGLNHCNAFKAFI